MNFVWVITVNNRAASLKQQKQHTLVVFLEKTRKFPISKSKGKFLSFLWKRHILQGYISRSGERHMFSRTAHPPAMRVEIIAWSLIWRFSFIISHSIIWHFPETKLDFFLLVSAFLDSCRWQYSWWWRQSIVKFGRKRTYVDHRWHYTKLFQVATFNAETRLKYSQWYLWISNQTINYSQL